MSKLRVGVIGVGYLGRFHAEKYAAMPDVDLIGIVDADPARASDFAAKIKTTAFDEPSRLIGKIDAVSIVVPTVLHYRIARQFLEQGIHVLIEKPMTVTVQEADELVALAAGKGLVLQVGHIERFNPAVTAIKSLIASPRYMTAERAAPFTVRCTDVNVVLDLMIHDLDIVCDLAGAAPRELSAAGASVITREIDMATARIVFANNCIADVTASRVSDEKKRLLRVFDNTGVYTSDYQTQKATLSCKGEAAVPELVMRDISVDRCDTLNEEIRAFVRCVRGNTKPMVSGSEGRQALALARMISENIDGNRTGFVPVVL
jgi:predicted dehydrogenase